MTANYAVGDIAIAAVFQTFGATWMDGKIGCVGCRVSMFSPERPRVDVGM